MKHAPPPRRRSTALFWMLLAATIVNGSASLRLLKAQDQSARNPNQVILEETGTPYPGSEVYSQWLTNLFESDELWRVKSKEWYASIISKHIADPSLSAQLNALYAAKVDLSNYPEFRILYDVEGNDGYVVIPEPLRAKVPHSMLHEIYGYQFTRSLLIPEAIVLSNEEIALIEATKERYFSGEDWQTVKKNIVSVKNKHYFPITPHTWRLLSDKAKAFYIHSKIEPQTSRIGLNPQIVIHKGDDLAQIAKKYAGERDYRPIERYLKQKLGSNESAFIPLEKILHPFIRKSIDTYAACHGPNCFNTGLNVNRGYKSKVEHTTANKLLQEAFSKYRVINPEEALQTGDLLIYCTREGKAVHAATYIDTDLVFSKNGINKFNPYIFQKRTTVESIYFSGCSGFRVGKAV